MSERRIEREEELEIIDVRSDEEGPEVEISEEESYFSDEKMEEIVGLIKSEYEDAESEVSTVVPKWNKWRRQARNRRETEHKDFPFPNSSNVSPPLAKIILNTVAGKLVSLFDTRKPFWSVSTQLDDDAYNREKVRVIEKYLDILFKSPYDLDGKRKVRKILREGALIGFAWVKVPWVNKTWNFKKRNEDGVLEDVEVTARKGPMLDLINPEDFIYKRAWNDFDSVPAVFHDITLPLHEVRNKIEQGYYEDKESELEEYMESNLSNSAEKRGERSGVRFHPIDSITITEARLFYDVDDDGIAEDLIITLHIPSGVVLKKGFNELGTREFEPVNYIDDSFGIEGSGTGETCEYLQDEADSIHNLRNDNMKLANTKMIAVKREGNVRAREKIFPGRIWRLGDPSKDIREINLGEVYPSSLQAEHMTLQYAERGTGMSDVMQGFSDPNLGTRDTFRGQALRAQQGSGLLSASTESIVESFSRIGMLVFMQLVLHKDEVIEKERQAKRIAEEEIDVLEECLKGITLEEIPLRLNFTIKTTDLDESMDSLRTNIINFTQMFTQFSMQIDPLAQKVLGPQAKQLQQQAPDLYKHWLEIYVGSAKMMKRVFELFGHEELIDTVPTVRKQEQIRDLLRDLNQQMTEMSNLQRLRIGEKNAEGNVGEVEGAGTQRSYGPGGGGTGTATGAGTPEGSGTGPA